MGIYNERIKQRFRTVFDRELNISNPKTFNEKVLSISTKLDKNDILLRTKCADKILLHNIIKERIGEDICVPIDGIYQRPEELRGKIFDEPHMVKCNHGSGMNIYCDKYIKESEIRLLSSLMKINWSNRNHEIWYKFIDRKILTEEVIPNIRNVRVYCSNGKAKLYEECFIRNEIKFTVKNGVPSDIGMKRSFDTNRLTYYDLDWNYIPSLIRRNFAYIPETLDAKPANLDKIRSYAEIISAGFEFVRVDFMLSDSNIYCEELTFAPGGGFSTFNGDGDELMYRLVFE